MSAESDQPISERSEQVTAERRLKELGITLPAPPERYRSLNSAGVTFPAIRDLLRSCCVRCARIPIECQRSSTPSPRWRGEGRGEGFFVARICSRRQSRTRMM